MMENTKHPEWVMINKTWTNLMWFVYIGLHKSNWSLKSLKIQTNFDLLIGFDRKFTHKFIGNIQYH